MNTQTKNPKRNRKDYKRAYCAKNRGKINEYQRRYRAENRDKHNKFKRDYYAKHPDQRKAYGRDYNAKNKDAKRAESAKRHYGLTLIEYDSLMQKPCAICGAPSKHLDHCHQTSTVRSALCRECNLGLGHFRDDPARLASATKYLLRWRERAAA